MFEVSAILFDWGNTLARVAWQNDAWRRGVRAACNVLAMYRVVAEGAAEELERAMARAEAEAAADPACAEVRTESVFDAWAQAYGWEPVPEELRVRAVRAFCEQWVGCLDPIPGALQTLATLRDRGYRLGLASNCWTPSEYAWAELRRQGFDRYLHAVTFSCEVGFRKPSAVFFRAAVNALALQPPPSPERVLFVGDSPLCDIAPAAAAGMRTAWVRGPSGAWASQPQATVRPDVSVRWVGELLPLLPSPPGP